MSAPGSNLLEVVEEQEHFPVAEMLLEDLEHGASASLRQEP
ncbi:MAG: hypothetical protein ACRDH1_01915 [Actinomycetota bacterium]